MNDKLNMAHDLGLSVLDCDDLWYLAQEALEEAYADEIVEMFGMEYSLLNVFRDTDPIAWRTMVDDYLDSMLSDDWIMIAPDRYVTADDHETIVQEIQNPDPDPIPED